MVRSARSVLFEGRRYLMYSDHERFRPNDGGGTAVIGTLTTPKLLRASGDRLQALYCDRIESKVTGEIAGPTHPPQWRREPWRPHQPRLAQLWQDNPDGSVTAETFTGMDARLAQGELEHGILEVTLTIERGAAAGLVFRQNAGGEGPSIVLDAQRGLIEYEDNLSFDSFRERRQAPIATGRPMHLRIVTRGEHIEAYLDDVLYLAFPRYLFMDYRRFGLFVDRSRATFRNLRARSLDVLVPWKSQ